MASIAHLFRPLSPPHTDNSHPTSTTPESAGSRFRKAPSISYQHAGLRDPRDRGTQRHKTLIIVIPPQVLSHQHGHLGHTLSLGPSHRLSQGIIMPLCPTLYAQLTAIAREFNFPSITGLCIYLHYTENDVTITPRISDDSWHLLWTLAFEGSSLSNRTLPISAKVEFDIDLRQAKWYPSWLSSSLRDTSDFSTSFYPYPAPSETHNRGDSRTVFDEHPVDRPDDHSQQSTHSTPLGRHVPRKLSLVERFDVGPMSKFPFQQPPLPPPEKLSTMVQTLSPIMQESEPQMARQDLNSRVQSWRATAMLEQTPLAAIGQTSLEPANIPNTVQIVPTGITGDLDPEEYTWSITSAGPDDSGFSGVPDSERVPSVHLAGRLVGSVCLTTSTHTSFGPLDDQPFSPIESVDRLPSPDLAHRAIENVPLTPITSTTWGPPLSFPTSPSAVSYAESVDLARRHILSPPLTPSTATSWGPPLSDVPSPDAVSIATTPDIAYRVLSWPHSSSSDPHTTSTSNADSSQAQELSQTDYRLSYPFLNIYPAVYPFFDLYPETAGRSSSGTVVINTHAPLTAVDVYIAAIYPVFDLYLAVYPWSLQDIYRPNRSPRVPIDAHSLSDLSQAPSLRSSTIENWTVPTTINEYPSFNLYPSVYPYFDLYPRRLQCPTPSFGHDPQTVSVHCQSYPVFNLYPAVYPDFNIYPSIDKSDYSISVHQPPARSPTYVEKPASIHYQPCHVALYPDLNIYPIIDSSSFLLHVLNWGRVCSYPVLDIYPAVYPYFNLYPAFEEKLTCGAEAIAQPVDVNLKSAYPSIDIYPLIYPYFNIYPPLPDTIISRGHIKEAEIYTQFAKVTPEPFRFRIFNLYPLVYPHFDLYPVVTGSMATPEAMQVSITPQYPAFNLYPAVYPHFDLWPFTTGDQMSPRPKSVSRRTHAELHILVLKERARSHSAFVWKKPKKSHQELHKFVFPDCITFEGDRSMHRKDEEGAKYPRADALADAAIARQRPPTTSCSSPLDTSLRAPSLSPQQPHPAGGDTVSASQNNLQIFHTPITRSLSVASGTLQSRQETQICQLQLPISEQGKTYDVPLAVAST
ncbi:hypothetical protein AX17_000942 [Amanita inopinata Kibby_2008]|nr:hypothetical protein AX17_000942 [Amanita inopinata Kibby_2008]